MIKRTFDLDRVKQILIHPAIWPHIAPENIDPDTWMPPKDCIYLLCDGGVFICHSDKYGMKIHANMLPEYRGDYAVEACREAVDWMFENTEIDALYCTIPLEYPSVAEFAHKCGFLHWKDEDGKHVMVRRKWDL